MAQFIKNNFTSELAVLLPKKVLRSEGAVEHPLAGRFPKLRKFHSEGQQPLYLRTKNIGS